MPPAQERLYTGIITADPEIRPTKIGGTWYPSCIDHANPLKDVVLHFHGGGYTLGDGRTADCGFGTSITLKHTSVGHVFCPQYRLSANTGGRFPAALQDALTSYAYLIFDLAILPSNIILSGDSAGGHMALQLLRYISDHGAELDLPPPQCAWLWSPWCNAGPPLLDPTVVYKVPQYATDFLPDHHLISWSAETYTPRPETGISVHDPYITLLGSPFATPTPIFMMVGGAELNFMEVTGFFKEMSAIKRNRCEIWIEEAAPHDIFKCGNLLGFEQEAVRAVKKADEFLRHLNES